MSLIAWSTARAACSSVASSSGSLTIRSGATTLRGEADLQVRPDGTQLRQLTDIRGNEAHLAWSPDGQRILFASTRMGFKDEALYTGAPQPYGEIFVMRYDGAEVEQLTDNQWEEGAPAWSPLK